ncbi:MAG: hypothetical protein B9S32_13720 [Verrucomicrobia bacterium Tous-C9LFEB]|nr:MAG: hypothetical protein B9S32_13720 [Verrucomicrobia bacterium Tous-C9LFEB]
MKDDTLLDIRVIRSEAVPPNTMFALPTDMRPSRAYLNLIETIIKDVQQQLGIPQDRWDKLRADMAKRPRHVMRLLK